MNPTSFLCPDLEEAEINRQHVALDYCGDYYVEQARQVAAWAIGERPPKGVRIGELPCLARRRIKLGQEDEY